MNLLKIKVDFAGCACFLGEEVFTWSDIANSVHITDYPASLFQLISNRKHNQEIGYHWRKDWVTICPLESDRSAYFLSVKRSELRELTLEERTARGINVHRSSHQS